MSIDDFNPEASSPSDTPTKDAAHSQGQTQSQSGLAGFNDDPLNADNDTGTEGVTGTPPSSVATDEAFLEEAQDNLPSDEENAVEDIDLDPTIEPAGGSDPAKPSIDLDIEDEGEADDDEAEAQTEAP